VDLLSKLGEDFEHATWVLLHIVSGRMGPGLPLRVQARPTNAGALMENCLFWLVIFALAGGKAIDMWRP